MKHLLIGALLLSSACAAVAQTEALGTEFTYQGNLRQSGSPANGFYDFQFELFDVADGGAFVGIPVVMEDVEVIEGVFTVELDFGASYFVGDKMYIEISVREGASAGGYTGLLPRQKLTAVPYALHAEYVAMNAVGAVEVDSSEVQLRIDGNCTAGSKITAISETGSVTCEPDLDTTYSAGAGLTLDAGSFATNPELVQNRVVDQCPAGSSIQAIGLDGTVTCQSDQDTTYTAGAGLTLNAESFATDSTAVQNRVTGVCPPGSSIREIDQAGGVVCDVVNGSPIENVVVVAKSGGDFSTVTAALNSILDASDTNRYQIYVGPGIYAENVTMKPNVDLVGSGVNTTKITHSGNGQNFTLMAADSSEIRDLTVENDGSGSNSFALAVSVNGAEASLTNVRLHSFGASFNYTLYAQNGSQITLDRSEVSSSPGSASIAIYLFSSSVEVFNSRLEAEDDTNGQGIYTTGTSDSLHVVNSIVRGSTTILRGTSSLEALIANTELGGGGAISQNGATITCVSSRDSSFQPLTSACSP